MGVEYSFDCMLRVDGFGMPKCDMIDVVGSCKFVEQSGGKRMTVVCYNVVNTLDEIRVVEEIYQILQIYM